MSPSSRQRPRRLIAAAVLNTFAGVVNLGGLLVLALLSNVPEPYRVAPLSAGVVGLSTALMIVWSIVALWGIGWARWLMLFSAALFYGAMVIQILHFHAQAPDADQAQVPLVFNLAIYASALGFNAWALLSAKARRFFATAPAVT